MTKKEPALANTDEPVKLKEAPRPPKNVKARVEVAAAYNPNNPYGNWGGTGKGKAYLLSYNPDDLVKSKSRGIQIYQEMTREPVVKAALMQKVTSLLSVPWSVKPASSDPDHVDQAKFILWNLKRLQGGFIRDVYEMCDALVAGYSIQEKVYDFIPDDINIDYAGKVRLVSLKHKDPYYFGFAFDEFMNLLPDGVMMTQGAKGENNVPLPSDKFFIFSFLKKYENLYGQSDLRAAYRAFWIKDTAWKLRSVYMERFSGNNLKGKYPRSSNKVQQEANKQALLDIFKAWQNETGVALPDDLEIEVMQVATSSDSEYARAMADCNVDIAIGILGESLTLNEGRKTGARNMGEIHKEVVDLFIQFLDMILTADINEQIVRPLIDLNYYGVSDYPEFYWYPREDYDPVSFGDAVAKWQASGVDISKAWFYEKTRMPLPSGPEDLLKPGSIAPKIPNINPDGQATAEDGAVTDQSLQTTQATVLNGAQVTAATAIVTAVAAGEIPRDAGIGQIMILFNLTKIQAEQIMGSAGNPKIATTPNPKPEGVGYVQSAQSSGQKKEPATAGTPPEKMAEPSDPPQSPLDKGGSKGGYPRPLSRFEQFAEIQKIDTRLKIVEDKCVAASRPAYEKIFADILKQVEKKNVLESKDYAAAAKIAVNPGPLKDVFFKTLLTANMMGRADVVTETQNQGFDFGKIKKFAESFDWSVMDGPFTPEEAIKVFSGKVPMTKEQFDALAQQLMDKAFYVTGLDKLTIERDVKALLTDALNNGMDFDTFKFRLNELQVKYSTPAYGLEGAIGEAILDYHAETIFRTNIMSAYNDGRYEMYQDPDVKEYFPAYEYTAIMDGWTTEICTELDRKVYLADDPIWDSIWPPNHFNCRSTVVSINKFDFTRDMLAEKPSVEPAPGFGS